MSKARDEYYELKDLYDESTDEYVKELEAEKEELMELIADTNRRIKSGSFNIPMYENYYMSDVEKLLQRCKIGGKEMSEKRDTYEFWQIGNDITDKNFIYPYVKELEQEIEKRDCQLDIVINKVHELEAEKAELVETLSDILGFTAMYGHPMYSEFVKLLQKHTGE